MQKSVNPTGAYHLFIFEQRFVRRLRTEFFSKTAGRHAFIFIEYFNEIAAGGKAGCIGNLGNIPICGGQQLLRFCDPHKVQIVIEAFIHDLLKDPRKITVAHICEPRHRLG